MPLTQQVTIAYTEPQPLSDVYSYLVSKFGADNVKLGQGQHINGIPAGTIMVEPKRPPR